FSDSARDHSVLHSFPTRRSSDLGLLSSLPSAVLLLCGFVFFLWPVSRPTLAPAPVPLGTEFLESFLLLWGEHPHQLHVRVPAIRDRKSTRLNSSHVKISYAVFCL